MFAGILQVEVPTSKQNNLEQKDNIFTELAPSHQERL